MSDQDQFLRKASLVVIRPGPQSSIENYDSNPLLLQAGQGLDLSQLHFQFKTKNYDEEGPNSCTIRVYNLSDTTVQTMLKADFSRVVLQAGYAGSYGVIFDGTIKQFRTGRLNATDTYVDILAADGDLAYNYGTVSATLAAAQNTRENAIKAVGDAWKSYGVAIGENLAATGGVLPRGKVLFGMGRTFMRDAAESAGCTWSIQNGKVNVIPLTAYLPGQAVRLTAATGLVGVPEQTQDGIKCRCLLNPKIAVGGRIQIDNASINRTLSQQLTPGFQLAADQWAQVQNFANVARDGFYRVYVAEHEGDTRGQPWYTAITALAIDNSSGNVSAYG